MTKTTFEKSFPINFHSGSNGGYANTYAKNGHRFFSTTTNGYPILAYNADVNDVSNVSIAITDGAGAKFAGDKVFFTDGMYVSELNKNTNTIDFLIDLDTVPNIAAVIQLYAGSILDITYFKGAYRLLMYSNSPIASYYAYTSDFVTFSDPVYLSNGYPSKFIQLDDDTLLLITYRSIHKTTTGVTLTQTSGAIFSTFGTPTLFNGVLYNIVRVGAGDVWVYKSVGGEPWQAVYDLVGFSWEINDLGFALEITNARYPDYSTAQKPVTTYIKIDSEHQLSVVSGPVMQSSIPYSAGKVTTHAVDNETWITLTDCYETTNNVVIYTKNYGETWLPFLELPNADYTGIDTPTNIIYTAPGSYSEAKQVYTQDACTMIDTYNRHKGAFLYCTVDGIQKIRRPEEATAFLGLPGGGLMSYAYERGLNNSVYTCKTVGGAWQKYETLLEFLSSQNGVYSYTESRIYDAFDTPEAIYFLIGVQNKAACIARYDVSKKYANEKDAWSQTTVFLHNSTGYLSNQRIVVLGNTVIFTANANNVAQVYVSYDSGASFTLAIDSPASAGFGSIAYACINGDKVLLGSSSGRAFFTKDAGKTWMIVYPKIGFIGAVWVFANGSGFIGIYDNDYMYSSDGVVWFNRPEDTYFAGLTYNPDYGSNMGIESVGYVKDHLIIFPDSYPYSFPQVFPDNGLSAYPFLIKTSGFWTDFVNCNEV